MKSIEIRAEQILDYCQDEGGQYGKWGALNRHQRTFLKSFATDILEYIKSTDAYIRQLEKEIPVECAKTYAEEHKATVLIKPLEKSEGQAHFIRKPYNKEWLLTLSTEELADLIIYGLQNYARASTSPLLALKEWLDKPHDENDPVERFFLRKDV